MWVQVVLMLLDCSPFGLWQTTSRLNYTIIRATPQAFYSCLAPWLSLQGYRPRAFAPGCSPLKLQLRYISRFFPDTRAARSEIHGCISLVPCDLVLRLPKGRLSGLLRHFVAPLPVASLAAQLRSFASFARFSIFQRP